MIYLYGVDITAYCGLDIEDLNARVLALPTLDLKRLGSNLAPAEVVHISSDLKRRRLARKVFGFCAGGA